MIKNNKTLDIPFFLLKLLPSLIFVVNSETLYVLILSFFLSSYMRIFSLSCNDNPLLLLELVFRFLFVKSFVTLLI
jgi:hypothetical protein